VCFGGRIRKTSRHWHGYGQLLVADDRYLVDDSYCVRDRARSLPRDLLDEDGGEYLLKASLEQAAPRAGLHYLVGAVHGHFGHFILEGLSRLWLLDRLAERDDLRFVVYEPELGGWQLEVLAAAGVPSDRIVHVTEPMRFERLIVPSRAYVLHRYTSQAQDDVWQKIGRRYPGADDHRSVFLSRAGWRNAAAAEKAAITRTSSTDVQERLWERLDDLERRPPGRIRHRWHSLRQRLRRSQTIVRPILNEHEIEALFAGRGFAVVRPETLPVAEQIALVRSADRLAGPVGSAMYLTAFMRAGADVFLIAPPRFAFVDDVQIAHFRNARLAYLFGDEQESDVDPRFARWSVDLRRLASSVDAWLRR
jgi:capsular polysaccharide biosynthesis protein